MSSPVVAVWRCSGSLKGAMTLFSFHRVPGTGCRVIPTHILFGLPLALAGAWFPAPALADGAVLTFEEIAFVGSRPGPMVTGDFDGDGRPDLAVALQSPASVAVFFGDGAGDFPTSATFTTGGGIPTAMTAGDYNGDGRTDLAVSHSGENSIIAILIGLLTDGSTMPVSYPGGGGLMVQGDFDGDGRIDLVLPGDGSVSFLRGRGDGTFADPLLSQFPSGNPLGVTAGDVDGDGRADLFLAEPGGSRVHFLRGNGKGSFGAGEWLTVGSGPRDLLLTDVNLDGHTDLVAANDGSDGRVTEPQGSLSVLPGRGDGTFAEALHHLAARGWSDVEAGDFNADGWPDLAALNESSASITLLLNRNQGRFMETETHGTGPNPTDLILLDYNRDSLPDLVSAAEGDGSVRFGSNVVRPRASALASGRKLRIRSFGGWYQELFFNFATRELQITGTVNSSGDFSFEQPFGQWTGAFHYSYAQGGFIAAQYGTKQLLLPAVQLPAAGR